MLGMDFSPATGMWQANRLCPCRQRRSYSLLLCPFLLAFPARAARNIDRWDEPSDPEVNSQKT